MGEDDIVYVRGHTGTGAGVYHTNKGCTRLSCIENPLEKPLSTVPNRSECSECANGRETYGKQDHSYQNALQEASDETDAPSTSL